ncbi:MAG: hypothetical protein JWQ28_1460, partial [Pedobacter sp.]|nr:hypothetical protein [Pedobacter sp.]
MKKIILALVPALFILACTKDVTTLNVDPKKPLNVSSSSLFTSAQHNLMNTITSPNVNSNIFRLIEQQWQETTYIDESQYNLQSRNIPDNLWNNFYRTVLKNFEESKKIMPTDVTDAAQLKNSLAILDIMEVYTWHYIVTTYGNVPYSEALNVDNTFPKYDDAQTIYKDLLTRLDADLAALDPAAASLGSADAFYDGNPAQWKKFGNSLKLKLAMVLSDADAATSRTAAESAVTGGLLASNADNAKFPYVTTTPNTNPVWVDLIQSGRLDFVAASTITNIMNGLNDPRRPLYFTRSNTAIDPVTKQYIEPIAKYEGGTPGVSSAYPNFSHASPTITNADFPGNLLDYSEVQFLLAEAAARGYNVGGTAPVFYANAIRASILDWGGTDAEAAAYLLQPSVAYVTAPGDYRQKIGTQKWIALYNRGIDAWVEQRRLDYPVLAPAEDAFSGFPVRFTYPVNEQNVN